MAERGRVGDGAVARDVGPGEEFVAVGIDLPIGSDDAALEGQRDFGHVHYGTQTLHRIYAQQGIQQLLSKRASQINWPKSSLDDNDDAIRLNVTLTNFDRRGFNVEDCINTRKL